MKRINRRLLLCAALLLAALLALAGLTARLRAEMSNKTVAFVSEYRELASLSYQSGEDSGEIWKRLNALGLMGVAVSEFTGEELAIYSPLAVRLGAAADMLGEEAAGAPNRAVLRIKKGLPYTRLLIDYINKKLPASRLIDGAADYDYILLPGTIDEFKISAFIPDFSALEFCRANNVPALFRPGPCTPASGSNVADSFVFLLDNYPQIRNLLPAGLIAPGYPELAPLASVMKERGITLSQVEFVRQIGVSRLAAMTGRLVIPMHSLTRDEIISRNINRRSIAERFVRAVHERSIRLLMVHPYDLQMGGRLEIFADDLSICKEALEARGYNMGWPEPIPSWPAPAAGAAACGLVLVFTLWFYISRMRGSEDGSVSLMTALTLFALSLAVGLAVWKLPPAARLLGGLCGALAAAEASLTALESSYNRPRGALLGLLIVITGGLSIASFYGTSAAALRLTPFSGVKLTLLLPPLLIVIHDLTRRVHPEGFCEILRRPAIWGELALAGVMLLALLVVALRSDNVSNVPALEVAFRDFMERVMLVRPRTKEFLIGYPALVLYWYVVRSGLIPQYREVLRLAAALAFCSAVNTFCHFHTLLYLSVIRVLNGWWLGLLLGAAGVLLLGHILLPLRRRLSRGA
ncbi:MAG: DUF5693 family protein [Synergistaceae bacterium]|nr:DUF5693 family protein [Synergistaceae bacterium]